MDSVYVIALHAKVLGEGKEFNQIYNRIQAMRSRGIRVSFSPNPFMFIRDIPRDKRVDVLRVMMFEGSEAIIREELEKYTGEKLVYKLTEVNLKEVGL